MAELCCICGTKTGILSSKTIVDGKICSACAEKLSPFYMLDKKRTTAAELIAQVKARAENYEKLQFFTPDRKIEGVFFADEKEKLLCADFGNAFFQKNPELIRFDQVKYYQSAIEREEFVDDDTYKPTVSVTGHHHKHAYYFLVELVIDHPYLDTYGLYIKPHREQPESRYCDNYYACVEKQNKVIKYLSKFFPSKEEYEANGGAAAPSAEPVKEEAFAAAEPVFAEEAIEAAPAAESLPEEAITQAEPIAAEESPEEAPAAESLSEEAIAQAEPIAAEESPEEAPAAESLPEEAITQAEPIAVEEAPEEAPAAESAPEEAITQAEPIAVEESPEEAPAAESAPEEAITQAEPIVDEEAPEEAPAPLNQEIGAVVQGRQIVLSWRCEVCGSENAGAYCPNCGTRKPVNVLVRCCTNCRWVPAIAGAFPKYCPACGKAFDQNN